MTNLATLLVAACSTLVAADPDAEIKAIQKIMVAREEAWARRDVESLVNDFAPDGDSVDSRGTFTRGHDAIRKLYAEMAKSPLYADAKFHQEVVQVRLHGPALAIADGDWTVSGAKNAAGEVQPDRNGHSTAIMVHNGKKWEIAAIRSYIRGK